MDTYEVTEFVEKNELRVSGAPTPGVKLFAAWKPRRDVARTEIRQHWDEHVALANRIHIGVARYARNWVEALAMSSGSYPAPYQGFATQHFPTLEELKERLFDTPASMQVINDDVADFIECSDVLLTTEYVIKR